MVSLVPPSSVLAGSVAVADSATVFAFRDGEWSGSQYSRWCHIVDAYFQDVDDGLDRVIAPEELPGAHIQSDGRRLDGEVADSQAGDVGVIDHAALCRIFPTEEVAGSNLVRPGTSPKSNVCAALLPALARVVPTPRMTKFAPTCWMISA